jgi:hypothetical protein
MDEFHRDATPMPKSKDTPDITRIPAVDDAPSIVAPEASPEAATAPVIALESAAPEAPAAPAPAVAAGRASSVDIVPEPIGSEAPSLPRAAQLETPATPAPEHKAEAAHNPTLPGKAPSQAGRFTLLAASLALAACLGAIGGSLGIAGYERIMQANAPAAPAPAKVTAAPDQNAEEIKLLKETIAQLRANTKALNDGLAALRTGLANTTAASAAQMTKIAETLDRVERRAIVAQAPQPAPAAPAAPAVPQAAPETTGSVLPRPAAPAATNEAVKLPIVPGWVLRKVYDGAALIEGREGIIEVEPGAVLPGAGRVERIARQDGRWVVVTTRGLIVPR